MLLLRSAAREGSILKFTLLALLAALPPGGTDPRAGSWTLVSAQSSLTPPDKLTITAEKDTMHVVMSGERHLDFTAKADGHDTPVAGNPGFDQVELHRTGKRQSEVTEKKAGQVVATVRDKLSNDGTELTIVTAQAGHPPETTVWTRTGGAKVAHDPLAGEWTEDLSKTRLRQGLALKIEPDGAGGVRFSGQDTYTARLDGKPYEVKNSRNDTVSLELADPHTVNATYRRDNQVTQRDRWELSPDGQQMTLTSTGSLENGQHLTEKLVFKRQ